MRTPFLLLLLLSLVGCSSSAQRALDDAQRASRMNAALRRLALDQVNHGLDSITVCMGDGRGRAAAFAWADGRILLTRELVDLLDDDALAAAIAHELGHLMIDHHRPGWRSLTGELSDAESAADVAGIRLLQACGISPSAMTQMLRQVGGRRDISRSMRQALVNRANRLEGVAGPQGPATD